VRHRLGAFNRYTECLVGEERAGQIEPTGAQRAGRIAETLLRESHMRDTSSCCCRPAPTGSDVIMSCGLNIVLLSTRTVVRASAAICPKNAIGG
jgi:hypothetical protein